jgi:hypothetical protein
MATTTHAPTPERWAARPVWAASIRVAITVKPVDDPRVAEADLVETLEGRVDLRRRERRHANQGAGAVVSA